ncbi:G-protein coupled receptor 35-like [Hyla sarda]|uniref:G-protein coupled receptor 35-like n=1 Tax=Hyla sarda TaxID=327740 RepID=UPI0024C38213|nr:G-protein coupled receptor 35-like [Hyla sarda]XP_056419094.1 G-protein coupled receptor 35-like [Hyla sarda]
MAFEENNCSFTKQKIPFQTFSLVTYIPLFMFGIICNVLALWVFCCKMQKWTETTLFMVNLVVADILVVLTFPFRLYASLYEWDHGSGLCKALMSSYFLNMYMSIFTITTIASDRYLAVRHPMKYKSWMSLKKASVICCVFWILFITVGVLKNLESRDHTFTTCFQKDNIDPFNLSPVFVVVGFALPLLGISFCSGKVIMSLKVKTTRDKYKQCSVQKAVKIVIANLVSFVICFSPIHIGYAIRFVAESLRASCYILEKVNDFIHVANFMANLNCILDSVGYYFAANEFWDVLSKRKFTLPKCKSSCVS